MVVKVRAVLKRSEEEVPRADLCNYLRTAIAEQRRVDATYASAEGSIPSAQAAALSVEPREKEMELRLVLPPEPQSAKGTKGRPVRKHRHTTRVSPAKQPSGQSAKQASGVSDPVSQARVHTQWYLSCLMTDVVRLVGILGKSLRFRHVQQDPITHYRCRPPSPAAVPADPRRRVGDGRRALERRFGEYDPSRSEVCGAGPRGGQGGEKG
jgi:hypothetical protein